jgi:hypothetical protein
MVFLLSTAKSGTPRVVLFVSVVQMLSNTPTPFKDCSFEQDENDSSINCRDSLLELSVFENKSLLDKVVEKFLASVHWEEKALRQRIDEHPIFDFGPGQKMMQSLYELSTGERTDSHFEGQQAIDAIIYYVDKLRSEGYDRVPFEEMLMRLRGVFDMARTFFSRPLFVEGIAFYGGALRGKPPGVKDHLHPTNQDFDIFIETHNLPVDLDRDRGPRYWQRVMFACAKNADLKSVLYRDYEYHPSLFIYPLEKDFHRDSSLIRTVETDYVINGPFLVILRGTSKDRSHETFRIFFNADESHLPATRTK